MPRRPNKETIVVGRVQVNPVGEDRWRIRWTSMNGRAQERRRRGRDNAVAEAARIDAQLETAGAPTPVRAVEKTGPGSGTRRPAPPRKRTGPHDLLADVIAAAIDPSSRPSWGRRHSDRLASLARCHLVPNIGDLRAGDVRPGDFARVLTGMQNAGYQGSTINGVLTLMKTVVEWGRHNGVWGPYDTPLYGVSIPKAAAAGLRERTGRIDMVRVPSHEQCEALCTALAGRAAWQIGARLTIKTGIRLGELLAVGDTDERCNRFDRHRRELAIDWQWSQYDDGTIELTLPKHDKRRVVVVPEGLADELADALEGRTRLITDRKGGVPKRSNITRRILRPAMDAAGWPTQLTWHSLRHRAAVDMVNALKLADASAMLGHSNPAFTLARYVGIDDEHLDRVRDADW